MIFNLYKEKLVSLVAITQPVVIFIYQATTEMVLLLIL